MQSITGRGAPAKEGEETEILRGEADAVVSHDDEVEIASAERFKALDGEVARALGSQVATGVVVVVVGGIPVVEEGVEVWDTARKAEVADDRRVGRSCISDDEVALGVMLDSDEVEDDGKLEEEEEEVVVVGVARWAG